MNFARLSPHRLSRVLLLFALLAAVPAASFAQGTSNTLPDPISTQELTEYANRYLNITDEQMLSIQPFHDRYKADFKRLREGDIQELMEQMKLFQGGMPSSREMEEFLTQQNRVMDKINTLDERLFNHLGSVLNDRQVAHLPRVRKARQRTIYTSGMGQAVMFGRRVDLTELVYTLKLSPPERDLIDPILINYENKLTKDTEKVYLSTITMYQDMIEELEDLGFTKDTFEDGAMSSDPEKMKEMMDAMKRVWKDVGRRSAEAAAEIAQLNHKTIDQLMPALDRKERRALKALYYRKAYPEIGLNWQNAAYQNFEQALNLRTLPEQLRQKVEDDRESYVYQDDQIIEKVVDYIDESRLNSSIFEMGSGWQKRQEKIKEWREQRQQLSKATVDSLHNTLGEKWVERMKNPQPEDTINDMVEGFGSLIGEEAGALMSEIEEEKTENDVPAQVADAVPAMVGGGQIVPGPITVQGTGLIKKRLGLNSDDRAVLDMLHSRYNQQYAELEEISTVKAARQQRWKTDEDGGYKPPSPETIAQLFSAKEEAAEAINALDREFFENVAVTTDADQDTMRLLKLARSADVYSSNDGGYMWGQNANEETQINLVTIVNGLSLSESETAAADRVLLRHADKLSSLLKDNFRANLRSQRLYAEWGAQFQADDSKDQTAALASFNEAMNEIRESRNEISTKLRTLYRRIKQEVTRELSSASAAEFRYAYDREAFPEIFKDPHAAVQNLSPAAKLGDLTDRQKEKIDTIEQEYNNNYAQVSRKMVAIARKQKQGFSNDPKSWQKRQEQQNELAKLRFDRNEVSAKANLQLRAALSDAQIERIPGLKTND